MIHSRSKAWVRLVGLGLALLLMCPVLPVYAFAEEPTAAGSAAAQSAETDPAQTAPEQVQPETAQPQTEPGLVQHHVGHNEQYHGNGSGEVEILEDQSIPEGLALDGGEAEGLTGDAGPAGNLNGGEALTLDGPGQNHSKSRCKLV